MQTKGLKRDTIDKFYTKNIVVELCLEYMKKYIKVENNDLIIEPSAGNGSFIDGIKSLSNHSIFYDLDPENDEIIRQDYLTGKYNDFKTEYNKIHVLGNPPFGRQSSLAIKFIKKSCEFCDTFSFILPKSFKKDSLKNKVPLQFHNVFEIDLPDNSFLVDGVEHDVPCVFQIWMRHPHNRNVIEKLTPLHFEFVTKNDDPHISCRRVGVNAGTISTDIEGKSVQSHYFIVFTNDKSIQENLTLLSTIKYDFNNTVGPKSISKQELIAKFNPLFEK